MKKQSLSVGERIAEKVEGYYKPRLNKRLVLEDGTYRRQDIAALIDQELSQVAEGNADTARLDWLERRGVEIYVKGGESIGTDREAIDAAARVEPTEKEEAQDWERDQSHLDHDQ